MSILAKIFGGGASALLSGIEGVIDKIVTTDKERDALKIQMKQMLEQYALDHEAEISKRHQYDMNSDSWLSKNVRPLSLVYSTVIVTLMTFTDGNIGGFTISNAYVNLFQNLMLLQYGFYFGSRAIEKYNVLRYGKELERSRTESKKPYPNIKRREIEPVDL